MPENVSNCPVAFLLSLWRKFTEPLVICKKEVIG